jgi:hypothetical protein
MTGILPNGAIAGTMPGAVNGMRNPVPNTVSAPEASD